MLKTKVITKHYPPKKVLDLFKTINDNYEITNGYEIVIDKTNIKQIFPIIYKFNGLTIYHFVNEESTNKCFYIIENQMVYDFNDLKLVLTNM